MMISINSEMVGCDLFSKFWVNSVFAVKYGCPLLILKDKCWNLCFEFRLYHCVIQPWWNVSCINVHWEILAFVSVRH